MPRSLTTRSLLLLLTLAATLPGCRHDAKPAEAPPPAAAKPESPVPPVPPVPERPASAQPATLIPASRADQWWVDRHNKILAEVRKGGCELAFLGDSITQGWEGEGKDVWAAKYGQRHAVNLGIGGDRTQHVLYRLDNGLLDALTQASPPNRVKAVVLMIGTNNCNDNTGEEIAEGIKAIVGRIRARMPETRILLLAIFPRGERPDPIRERLAMASRMASTVADGKNVVYLDVGSRFLRSDGMLTKEIMPDYLHLSPGGYAIWADSIESSLSPMLK